MYVLRTRTHRRAHAARRGTALIGLLFLAMALSGLVMLTTAVAGGEARSSRGELDDLRAGYLAEAGVERGLKSLKDAIGRTAAYDPFFGMNNMLDDGPLVVRSGSAMTHAGVQVGAYSVRVTRVEADDESITVDIESTGYLPDAPENLAPGQRLTAWSSISTRVRYELAPSKVFDYAYFINNWGWFYGNTIHCNGNARSNGQFDVAGYSPSITGQPMYENVEFDGTTATLAGYQDDNNDGLQDGEDGGVFSGWDIVGAQNLQGNGGNAQNQHDFQDEVPMPNLSDMTIYELQAIDEGGSITIGGVTMVDAVAGDDGGELQNIYLHGTAADPVVLNGPVVVRGNVMISGIVTGQGAIYASGNVYVPDSINYANPPTTVRPADETQATTEAWLAANWDADFLGLFSGENIVVGDVTNSTWQNYVGRWMNSSLNGSSEDAGEDGVPNTHDGRDGISGTEDDDILENDGQFTVEYYSAEDAELGLIPPGAAVGDVVPGTGEDIDGDGVYDGTTTLADVALQDPLDQAHWDGNMPVAGIDDYSDIATLYASELDAVFYTNHSFCYTVLGNEVARINGALISRNENIIYGTPSIEMNYDVRMLGGNSGIGGNLLPKVVAPPQFLRWMMLDTDPNHLVEVEEEPEV